MGGGWEDCGGGWKCRLFTWFLLAWVGPQFFVVFFWNTAVFAYKFSVLLGCPFPGSLARESRLLLGLLSSVSIGVSMLLASPALYVV